MEIYMCIYILLLLCLKHDCVSYLMPGCLGADGRLLWVSLLVAPFPKGAFCQLEGAL